MASQLTWHTVWSLTTRPCRIWLLMLSLAPPPKASSPPGLLLWHDPRHLLNKGVCSFLSLGHTCSIYLHILISSLWPLRKCFLIRGPLFWPLFPNSTHPVILFLCPASFSPKPSSVATVSRVSLFLEGLPTRMSALWGCGLSRSCCIPGPGTVLGPSSVYLYQLDDWVYAVFNLI